MEHFLSCCSDGLMWAYIDDEYRPMFRNFRMAGSDEDYNMVGVSDDYCIFGIQKRDLIVCKTIITHDMVKDFQKEFIEDLRRKYESSMVKYYNR